MPAEFVHLHVHSQYSFLTGAVKLSAIAERAKEHGMRAIALTDHGNMFGALRHYNACRAAGVQPIVGCEVNVVRPGSAAVDHLVLLAATNQGYKNLIRLVSKGSCGPRAIRLPASSFRRSRSGAQASWR
jgi:DNA polymerase-3 subunit alpha